MESASFFPAKCHKNSPTASGRLHLLSSLKINRALGLVSLKQTLSSSLVFIPLGETSSPCSLINRNSSITASSRHSNSGGCVANTFLPFPADCVTQLQARFSLPGFV